MRIQSPLSNITDVLNQIKSSATQYKATLSKNEAATRAVLIDPVLRALGWDTANTYMVEVEKSLSQTRVDYALYDSNTDVKIIVEAKALGGNLSQQNIIMTLVTYAFTYGLQDIFLTDGLVWHHFTNFQPGNVVPTHTIDIVNDNPVDCAAYLVQRLDAAKFWPEEQTIDVLSQQVIQLESAVSTLQQEVARLKAEGADMEEASSKVSAIPSPTLDNQYTAKANYIELESLLDATRTKPTLLRLPDSTTIQVKVWKDVLRECCKFVLANNKSINIPFPDRSGRKVNLLDVVRPAKGISYLEQEYNGQQIYIYANYDANNCVANSAHILKQVSADDTKVLAAVAYIQGK